MPGTDVAYPAYIAWKYREPLVTPNCDYVRLSPFVHVSVYARMSNLSTAKKNGEHEGCALAANRTEKLGVKLRDQTIEEDWVVGYTHPVTQHKIRNGCHGAVQPPQVSHQTFKLHPKQFACRRRIGRHGFEDLPHHDRIFNQRRGFDQP